MAQEVSPLDTGHAGPIHAARLDHFGRRLATASEDNSVRIWDIGARCFVTELRGHSAPVWAISWSHPKFGPLLASSGEDRRILFHRESEPEWALVHAHDAQDVIMDLAFSPWEYGIQVAAARADGRFLVLSWLDPERRPPPTPSASVRRKSPRSPPPGGPGTPEQRDSPKSGRNSPKSGRGDRSRDETKATNWMLETVFAHAGGCFTVCWAPAASPADERGTADARQAIASNKASAKHGAANAAIEARPSQEVESTFLQPRRLVTGGADKQVRIWRHDMQTSAWAEQHHLQANAHGDWVRDVSWRPHVGIPANTIASCAEDGTVVIWREGMEGERWSQLARWSLDAAAWQVSWSVTGSILAVSTSDNQVRLYKELLDSKWVCTTSLTELGAGDSLCASVEDGSGSGGDAAAEPAPPDLQLLAAVGESSEMAPLAQEEA